MNDKSGRTFTWAYASPLGAMTLASDGNALTGLWFDGQKYFGSTLTDERMERRLDVFDNTCRWLDAYFSGHEPGFMPRLRFDGTPFRRRVWQALMRVPYDATTTYSAIAAGLAWERRMPSMSLQAVGGAVAHNPISIIVPCHRVLATNGSLTGYAGGLWRKQFLLALERSL